MNPAQAFLRKGGGRGVLLAALLAALPTLGRAQQVLVEANVAADTLQPGFGPNRRWFGHGYVGLGLVAGPAEAGAALRYGVYSGESRVGLRLKRRLSQAFALHADLAYTYLRYELAQQAGKTLPGPQLHEREALTLHQAGSELGLRLNYGRRGNAVGRYLDVLAGGNWVFASRHTVQDAPPPGTTSLEITEAGLMYLRRWTGSAGARLGFDRYALTARYRLTPTFTPDFAAWPELPRWVLGVELGVF